METRKLSIDDTLWQVEGLPLPHPAGALLRSFIVEAVNSQVAATYVLSRISSTEEAHRLVSDWLYIVESSKLHASAPEETLN